MRQCLTPHRYPNSGDNDQLSQRLGYNSTSEAIKIASVDLIDQRGILSGIKFCALALAALQGRFCFIQPLHCRPPPVPYRAHIPRSSLPSWVIRLSGNADKSTQRLYVAEPA